MSGAPSEESAAPFRAATVLEGPRPLSKSIIWAAQDDYYGRAGRDAWASGDVPHTLTTGPIVARTYARLVEAFVADLRAGRMGEVEWSEPIYVVELGSGSGRLAFEFLRALDSDALGAANLVYVATDKVDQNVAAVGQHPALLPYLEMGVLDSARFIAGADAPLRLERAGRTLTGPLANPLIVLSNYLFDVIPQDLFALEQGELFEELVTTCAESDEVAVGDHDFFRRIFLATNRIPVSNDRYGGSALDEILALTAARRRDGRFLYPGDALRALRQLLELAGGRMLALIGERPGRVPSHDPETAAVEEAIRSDRSIRQGPAVVHTGELQALRPGALLSMGVHGGSMSLPVDLSILARAALPQSTSVLLPDSPPSVLLVAAMVTGESASAVVTKRTYRRVVNDVGPEDVYLLLKAALGDGATAIGHAEHLAVLRSGGYDPYLLRVGVEAIEAREGQLDAAELEELERVLDRTYAHEFPIDDTDLAYGLGSLLAPLGAHEAALRYFERSASLRGAQATTAYNVALCHLHLGDVEAAITSLREALALDAGFEPAAGLLQQVLAERARDDALVAQERQ